MRKTYRGSSIEVSFDLDRCIHARRTKPTITTG